jgi:hypothetical protein
MRLYKDFVYVQQERIKAIDNNSLSYSFERGYFFHQADSLSIPLDLQGVLFYPVDLGGFLVWITGRLGENVNLVIEESIVVVKGTAESKQVTLVSRLFPDIVAVEFDPSRMKQVFINLLTNAVQASPAGETVSVSSSVDGGKIVIDVTDHGPGLTTEQKENIFTPFFYYQKGRYRFGADNGEKYCVGS